MFFSKMDVNILDTCTANVADSVLFDAYQLVSLKGVLCNFSPAIWTAFLGIFIAPVESPDVITYIHIKVAAFRTLLLFPGPIYTFHMVFEALFMLENFFTMLTGIRFGAMSLNVMSNEGATLFLTYFTEPCIFSLMNIFYVHFELVRICEGFVTKLTTFTLILMGINIVCPQIRDHFFAKGTFPHYNYLFNDSMNTF